MASDLPDQRSPICLGDPREHRGKEQVPQEHWSEWKGQRQGRGW
jgi:hypothetical protein